MWPADSTRDIWAAKRTSATPAAHARRGATVRGSHALSAPAALSMRRNRLRRLRERT
jgi:hypothetical protein